MIKIVLARVNIVPREESSVPSAGEDGRFSRRKNCFNAVNIVSEQRAEFCSGRHFLRESMYFSIANIVSREESNALAVRRFSRNRNYFAVANIVSRAGERILPCRIQFSHAKSSVPAVGKRYFPCARSCADWKTTFALRNKHVLPRAIGFWRVGKLIFSRRNYAFKDRC